MTTEPSRPLPRSHRKELGKFFSEGARLMWLAIEREGVSMNQVGKDFGMHAGEIPRVLYGERKANGLVLENALARWGIPLAAWRQKPIEEFVPPAARDEAAA